MRESSADFAERLRARFPDASIEIAQPRGEVGVVFDAESFLEGCRLLRDEFGFEQLIDVAGVDYLGYGSDEWDTDVSSEGFSRGVEGRNVGRFGFGEAPTRQVAEPQGEAGIPLPQRRFAAVLQLLSVQHNRRVRVRVFAPNDDLPVVPSVVGLWPVANWFEREAFDMVGIVFQGHPDLRRILTDYGFVGHPFRKDFPLIGNVEVRYDAEKERVIYEPVTSVVPRVGVPRVVREDSRMDTAFGESKDLKINGGAQ